MCGIAGIVGRPDQARLDRMTDTLAHRGPDGRGTIIVNSVGFGHRLLKIVGECPQPLKQDGCLLTYNGELYGIPGSLSDTARLIPLYRQYGFPAMLDHLNGMFAFALYDIEAKTVYLARDRFGEKTLYYGWTPEGFQFASEIKALDTNGENPQGLAAYGKYLFTLGSDTFYRGIRRLEPGHWLAIRDDASVYAKQRYWQPPSVSVEPRPNDVAELKALIEDAVRIRTRSATPFATYVSGGLDSSLITCLARPNLTFHGEFSEPGFSEFDHAILAAKVSGAYLWSARIHPEDFDFLDELIYHLDEPVAGVGALGQWITAQLAAEQGIRVILSGQGADEIFGGYARYADCAGIPRPDGYGTYLLPEQYRGMTMDEAQRWDIEHSLPALLHVDDRVNMAHGIESRAPYLDHRIAEFVLARPTAWRLSAKPRLKGVLRDVARGIVPDAIIDRRDKKGFPVPLKEWTPEWKGTQRELWQEMSLAAWSRVFAQERLAA